MLIISVTSLIALLLSYLDSRGNLNGGMKAGFILVGTIAALHYDYGNDYMPYMFLFEEIARRGYTWHDIVYNNVIRNNEYGWGLLNLIFAPFGRFGFFGLVAAIAIFQNWIIYRLIKMYVDHKWWWFAVLNYLFVTSFYLINLSMLRQGLVVAAFFGLLPWIMERKVILCLPIVLLLSTIHTSALILIPFIFWGYLPVKNGKIYAVAFFVLFIVCFASRNFINSIFLQVLTVEQFDNYTNIYSSGADVETNFGLGFAIKLVPFCVTLYALFTKYCHTKNIVLLLGLCCIGYIVIPFVQLWANISRITMYFTVFSILGNPISYSAISKPAIRSGLILLFIFITFYDYIIFFYNPTFAEHFSEYKTIFSAL